MKNITVIFIAVVILVAVAVFLANNRTKSEIVSSSPSAISGLPTNVITGELTPTGSATEKVFNIQGQNYAFDVKEIKVKLNDKVTINFTNTEGMHDFVIDEFNIATKVIKTGESESVNFIADRSGTFEYYCSVGQHRANGMWGKLIVE
jgi:plastocyanin